MRLLTTIIANFFLALVLTGQSDLVLTEIMYNSPGEDLEFLEFYNASDSTINMAGYTLVEGVDYSFPAITLEAGDIFLITNDSLRFDRSYIVFDIPAHQWDGGTLRNSGETISLTNPVGDTTIQVTYDDVAPWPQLADGFGHSLILCDPAAAIDDPSNWQVYIDSTPGVLLSGTNIHADPRNLTSCPTEYEHWTSNQARYLEPENSDLIEVPIYLESSSTDTTIVTVWTLGSATADVDYNLMTDTLIFEPGQSSPEFVNIEILDDSEDEGYECIILNLTNLDDNSDITFLTSVCIQDDDGPLDRKIELKGVLEAPEFKAIEILVKEDIFAGDLIQYGIGTANNGNGTDSTEFAIWAGQVLLLDTPELFILQSGCAYITDDTIRFNQFFGSTDHSRLILVEELTMSFNGNDAIELFEKGQLIDVFGNVGEDGEGTVWEYSDGWARRKTSGHSTSFDPEEWDYSGIGELEVSTNSDSDSPYPLECEPSSVAELELNDIQVFPNPTHGTVHLKAEQKLGRISIIDVFGKEIMNETTPSKEYSLDLHKLPAGIYFIVCERQGSRLVNKLIVE